MHRYRMLYRPPGFATLPGDLRWSYVELPSDGSVSWLLFDHLPVSRHYYGVIETDRSLTADELRVYQIEPVIEPVSEGS